MNQPDQTLIEQTSIDVVDDLTDQPTPARNATESVSGTYAQMLGLTLQASLQEITEYTNLIKTAKTQAKKDYYQRKIKKIAKRLQRVLPDR